MALTYNTDQNDTIAAIATGISESGIGIIRVSGPDAIAVGEKIYRDRRGESHVREWKANTIHFGYIIDPETTDSSGRSVADGQRVSSAGDDSDIEKTTLEGHRAEPSAEEPSDPDWAAKHDDEIIDEVMVSIMRAPHSYTTEDTIEINCHGGVYLMHQVLHVVLHNGARMAEPGEFTKRAFLGGRIDLSRAEAVMDLIEAQNEFSRKTSLAQLEGSVQNEVKKLRSSILYEIAFIESALDDPENYSLEGYPQRLRKKCEELITELRQILEFSRNGRVLREGIRTAIVGKPNAGKSSLLNALAGEERAIVTDVAGTTRDTLEETVHVGNVVVLLTDTAGIHETTDKVEKIGVDRAKAAMSQADLILFVLDAAAGIDEQDKEIASMIEAQVQQGSRCICLLNKSDLPRKITEQDAAELLSVPGICYMDVSVQTGAGMSAFREQIQNLFHAGEIVSRNEVFLSGVRNQQEAEDALHSLELVVNSIDNGMSEDFFSIDLMNAYTSLGKIIGEAVEDDLVEEIFSRFCLGK